MTKTDLDLTCAELELKIVEAKADIIHWVLGIACAQAALILAVLKLFPAARP